MRHKKSLYFAVTWHGLSAPCRHSGRIRKRPLTLLPRAFERIEARRSYLLTFLAFFFGIIFLAASVAFLTADFAALTTRLVTDFFLDFLAIMFPLAFEFL